MFVDITLYAVDCARPGYGRRDRRPGHGGNDGPLRRRVFGVHGGYFGPRPSDHRAGIGGVGATLDGGGASTVLSVTLGTYVDLSGVSIQNGNSFQGGGIYNRGQLTITGSTISGNTAPGGGQGGGIYNNGGTFTVTASTISGNTAPGGGQGGGIFNVSTVTIIASTISGNTALGGGLGGGIFEVLGTIAITGSTISGNTSNGGGGIFNDIGAVVLAGDILATSGGPPAGGECADSAITDHGYNVSDDATCRLGAMTSVSSSAAAEDLGALGNNGGPTETILPTAGNPAINLIPTTGTTLCPTTDQRGLATTTGAPVMPARCSRAPRPPRPSSSRPLSR